MPLRQGVAKVCGHTHLNESTTPIILELGPSFFNDTDSKVRNSFSRIVLREDTSQSPYFYKIAHLYIDSQSFSEEATFFISNLLKASAPYTKISDIIILLSSKVAYMAKLSQKSHPNQHMLAISNTYKLLLRLYQTATNENDVTLQKSCLDTWDQLLQAGQDYNATERLLEQCEA